jgi:hypothetical protein
MAAKSLDIGGAVNKFADWATKSPLLNAVIGNPFSVSLIITALVAIVVMAVFHYKLGKDNLKKAVRAAFYVYGTVLLVMFLHHHVVSNRIRDTHSSDMVSNLMSDINSQTKGGSFEGYVNVQENLGAADDTPADAAASIRHRGRGERDGGRGRGERDGGGGRPHLRPNNVRQEGAGPFAIGEVDHAIGEVDNALGEVDNALGKADNALGEVDLVPVPVRGRAFP